MPTETHTAHSQAASQPGQPGKTQENERRRNNKERQDQDTKTPRHQDRPTDQ